MGGEADDDDLEDVDVEEVEDGDLEDVGVERLEDAGVDGPAATAGRPLPS